MIDIADVIAAEEATVPGLRAGCAKQIVWAGARGDKTRLSVVYIHGFSASREELRPLPDLVAKHLGANLYFTRLTGHGQDGDALAAATFADWQRDTDDAIRIGQKLGDEVILMGCSTGCTLITDALVRGATARAVVHVSPNFALAARKSQVMLDLPWVQFWGPLLVGKVQSSAPMNDGHRTYWTNEYPTAALFPMGDALRAVRHADLGQVQTPAAFAYNPTDQIVSAAATEATLARWGGPAVPLILKQTADDDPNGHVMAGDIFSPGQTASLAVRMTDWLDKVVG